MRHLVGLMVLVLTLSACVSPPAAIIGVDGTTISAFEVPGNTLVDVFVATSREPDADTRVFFGPGRSEDVRFAKVTVSIPPNHVVGQIERPAGDVPDPETEFAILAPTELPGGDALVEGIDRELAERASADRDVLLFVHGYNTDMTSAILRTAQFTHDIGFKGVPVVFSWASAGHTTDYIYDLNSALHARDSLVETGRLLSRTRSRGFHIVAHSMGNILTVEALRQRALEARGSPRRSFRIETVILAAPDIDLDLFRKQLRAIPVDRLPIFVLVSDDDKALAISRRIAGGVPRVGAAHADDLEDLGVTVVDLSAVEGGDRIAHTKFANSPKVVELIGRGINAGNELSTHSQDDGLSLGAIATLPLRIIDGGRVLVVD